MKNHRHPQTRYKVLLVNLAEDLYYGTIFGITEFVLMIAESMMWLHMPNLVGHGFAQSVGRSVLLFLSLLLDIKLAVTYMAGVRTLQQDAARRRTASIKRGVPAGGAVRLRAPNHSRVRKGA